MLDFLRDPADIMGISCFSKELPYAVLLSRELKKLYPHKKIILGGCGPSGMAEKLLEEFDTIDFVVTGEGDITIVELLKAIEGKINPEDVKGIAFKRNGQVIFTGERERIKDLDSLPLPAYNHINLNFYDNLYLTFSRGCPFRCTFCDQPAFWKGKLVNRSFSNVFMELDMLSKIKSYCEITFSDNIFCHNKGDFKRFCEEYKKRNYTFKFNMCRRLDDVDDEILSMAKDLNCEVLFYGVESGSTFILKEIKKNLHVDIKEILLKTADKIKFTAGSFIFNFPFETIYDFLDTMNIIIELLLTPTKNYLHIHLHYLIPIAGTEIFKDYGDRLIYRECANILTSGRNMEEYENYVLEENKKNLTFPPLKETKNKYSPDIRELVLKYKDIFISYYIYSSIDMETKEKFLKYLRRAINTNIMDYFFNHREYKIFLGRTKFYIISEPYNERDNAVFVKLHTGNLASFSEIFKKEKGKKIFLLPEFNPYSPGEIKTKLIQIFKDIIYNGIDYTLMKPLPYDIIQSIGSDFKNISSCKECPSMFSVDDEKITYCGGGQGRYFNFYSSPDDIYKEFLKRGIEKAKRQCLYCDIK